MQCNDSAAYRDTGTYFEHTYSFLFNRYIIRASGLANDPSSINLSLLILNHFVTIYILVTGFYLIIISNGSFFFFNFYRSDMAEIDF